MNNEPQTENQTSVSQVGQGLTADEIRSKIIETYQKFKPALDSYYDYAQRTAALSESYHAARLREVFQLESTEGVLLSTLDSRGTPKSLDNFLAGFKSDKPVKQIIFDRVAGKYHLFA